MGNNITLPLFVNATSPYSPLNSAQDEIRILYLKPGIYEDDIRIAFESVNLTDRVAYEALSYAWGTEQSPRPILVDDVHRLAITENLDCALRHFRYRDLTRTLWVDALCIDQTNLEERNQQIQLMGRIYSRAASVAIWLGGFDGYNFERFLCAISELSSPRPEATINKLLRELCQLGDSPWFTRVWVVQELMLSKHDPMVYFGHLYLPWSNLVYCFAWFDRLLCGSGLNEVRIDVKNHGLDHKIFIQNRMVIDLANLRNSDSQGSLFFILSHTSHLRATDPRDNIYGILAVCKLSKNIIKPDYTLSLQQVFAHATATMLLDLDLNLYDFFTLHCAKPQDGSRFRKTPDLPSWVVDPTSPSTVTIEQVQKEDIYWHPHTILRERANVRKSLRKLCTELPKSVRIARFSPDYKTLFAAGNTLGTITSASFPALFCGPGARRLLFTLYHAFAKPRGFKPATFYKALYSAHDGAPRPSHMQSFEDWLMNCDSLGEETLAKYKEVLDNVIEGARNKTLFITDSGHIGQSYHPDPVGIEVGDLLVGLFGINFPFIIRPLGEDRYRMINVAHVVDHEWGYIPRPENKDCPKAWLNLENLGLREFEII
jgi:hypothetical protein